MPFWRHVKGLEVENLQRDRCLKTLSSNLLIVCSLSSILQNYQDNKFLPCSKSAGFWKYPATVHIFTVWLCVVRLERFENYFMTSRPASVKGEIVFWFITINCSLMRMCPYWVNCMDALAELETFEFHKTRCEYYFSFQMGRGTTDAIKTPKCLKTGIVFEVV